MVNVISASMALVYIKEIVAVVSAILLLAIVRNVSQKVIVAAKGTTSVAMEAKNASVVQGMS
jgi:hypothetical protein